MFGNGVFKGGDSELDYKPEDPQEPAAETEVDEKPEVAPTPVVSSVFDFESEGSVEGFVSACKGLTEQEIGSGKTVTLKGCPASEVDIIGSSFRGQHHKPVYVDGDLRYPR